MVGSSSQADAARKELVSRLDPAQRSMEEQVAAILSVLEEKRRKIQDRLAALRNEERALLSKKIGFDHTIARLRGEAALPDAASARSARAVRKKSFHLPHGSINSIIVHLVSQAQDRGVTLDELLTAAGQGGVELDRKSIATSLSRFVKDDVLSRSGRRYRLKARLDETCTAPHACRGALG